MHVALAIVQVLFGANSVFGKVALRSVSPMAVLGARVPGAAIALVAIRAFVSSRVGWQRVEARDLPLFVVAALLGVTFNQILFFEGLARTSATNATVIMTTIPVFATGASLLLGRERATTRRVLGLVVALAGALVVALLGKDTLGALRLRVGTGELLLVGNSACYALYLVLSRRLFQRYRTDTAVAVIFTIAAVTMLPFGLQPLVRELPTAPPAALGAIAFVIAGPTVAAYFLNGFALRRASSTLVAIYIYVQPAVTGVLAAAFLHERITGAALGGALLIGCGIALVSTSGGAATGSARR